MVARSFSLFLAQLGGERRGAKCVPPSQGNCLKTCSLLLCWGIGTLHGTGPRHSSWMWPDSAYLTAYL